MDILLSHAIDGFILAKEVAGCSPHTTRNYTLALRRLQEFLQPSDPPLDTITANDIRRFLHQLQTTQFAAPGIIPRPAKNLAPKTLLNIHTALSSFWSWAAEEGYARTNIVRDVQPPRPAPPAIEPFSEEQIRSLLEAVKHSNPWKNRPHTTHTRAQKLQLRDRALILFLLDTGVRATELCNLRISDVDLKSGMVHIRGKSRLNSGQGKVRVVFIGKCTRRALWQYVTIRDVSGDAPLFATVMGRPLKRRHLAKHLQRLGERAGVPNTHPHRFRHTFAISYLRNGGDIFTLQQLLGHSSLDMVKRYLRIAQTDCAAAHRRASPVDNLCLPT